MFDQYYLQFQNVTDFSSPRAINFERKIYFSNFVEGKTKLDDYDLHFYLNAVYTTTTMTNRENNSKVIINYLNCLNFWFNFCVLDIHLYVQKFFGLFLKFYDVMLILRIKLNASCEALAFH